MLACRLSRLASTARATSTPLAAARSCVVRACCKPQPAARRRLCTDAAKAAEAKAGEAAAKAAGEAEATGLGWLLKEGQVDSGFYQGTGLLALVCGGIAVASDEQRHNAVASLLGWYRACGLKVSIISDRVLIEDHIRKNALAACNVLFASPVFYFMFSRIYGQPTSVCLVRAFTGSLRIVPFMGFFYGFFAVSVPFVTQYLMESKGYSYADAQGTAAIVMMLSGFVFIEALVELRGCGVTFDQMTAGSFIIFIPALIGRLATGVLTQQQKVGAAPSEPLLPASWADADAPTWQAHTYMLFDQLALDKEFVVTCAGTSVFQHVLNSITWVLLTRGKVTTLGDIFKFMLGGMEGTVLSGVSQFWKTFIMRLGFGWTWNWCSSQQIHLPVFDAFLKDAE